MSCATTGERCFGHGRHEERLAQLRGPANTGAINFIEYLELPDPTAPGAPESTLLVHTFFALPDALTAENLRIDGGLWVRPVPIAWAYPSTKIPPDLVTPAERALYQGLADAAKILVVRTVVPGDFSIYTLLLVASSDPAASADPDAPPAGFDPILSRVEFRFKIQAGSDCACPGIERPGACPRDASSPPSPPVNYLARDYASFRRLMLDRMAAVAPQWSERHAADLGVALVELVAYAADHLSYFQDAVATESYLGTARKRESVRRHALLLDYAVHDGCNARTWVAFDVVGDNVLLPRVDPGSGRRTQFFTQVANEPAVVSPDRFQQLSCENRLQVFEPMEDAVLREAHNAIAFYTWLESSCRLPCGATRATLREPANMRLKLRAGDVLLFDVVAKLDSAAGVEVPMPVANPALRHAVRLTRVYPEAAQDLDGTRTAAPTPLVDPLTGVQIVEIEWDAADALPWALCLSAEQHLASCPDPVVCALAVARGNLVLADHGATMPDEPLVPSLVSQSSAASDIPAPPYRPRLASGSITRAVPFDPLAAPLPAASRCLVQDPRAAVPQVRLTDGNDVWYAQRHLLRSDGGARDFVVEVGNDDKATLRFGDGVFGREPEDGLVAQYRVGNGIPGNIGAGAIRHVVSTGAGGVVGLANPLPATGGTATESIEDVRLYAPQALRVEERAVTEADWVDVAERHPDVRQAVARRRFTGSFYAFYVTIAPRAGAVEDAERFLEEMREFLDPYRMAGADLQVDLARVVPLDLLLGVWVKDGYLRSEISKALFCGMATFLASARLALGQPVHLSQVVATAMQVPGVAWVDFDAALDPNEPQPRFQRLADGPAATASNVARGHIPIGRLEIARLDPRSSRPEDGRLDFALRGGQ
jgi:hypothetical protein